MKSLFILKPDMVNDENAMRFFYSNISSFVQPLDEYMINDWIDVSSKLYEPDYSCTKDEKIETRKKILNTIKGYYDFFNDKRAILSIVDTPSEKLEFLTVLKKEIRKKFVYYNTDKCFIKFEDPVDYTLPLSKIDIKNLRVSYEIIPFFEEMNKQGYGICMFNKIHSPDPFPSSIERDLEILQDSGIICEKNKIKTKWGLYGQC